MQKFLSQILPSIEYELFASDGKTEVKKEDVANVVITNLVFDSRKVTNGSLFFALPGIHSDGNKFIPDAIEKGANAIVYQGELSYDIKVSASKACVKRQIDNVLNGGKPSVFPAFIKVKNARFSMAPLSDCFYDSPSKRLIVIGVTGTEGKSSTVSFIWQLLRLCGKKAGFISTVEYSFGGESIANPEHQTTPEAPVIQHHLNEMLENGCQYAVVEASSHGLSKKLNRLGNVYFDCAVFMNVTLEHLEFHKDFETYRSDKANLFRALDLHDHVKVIAGEKVKVPSIGIVNLEDPSASYFISATKKNVYGFTTMGKAGKAAAETGSDACELPEIPENIRYMTGKNIASARYGLCFSVDCDGKSSFYPENYDAVLPREHENLNIQANLPGAFNAYNIMASIIAVSSVANLSFSEVASKTQSLLPVKGRMTVIDKGQMFEVIVDYAHTPSSFETIFPPVRKRCKGRLFAVFGSGGERDLTKRPIQGEIAGKFCDIVVLADEDPRGENPEELLKMIALGAEKAGKKLNENLYIIPDRKKAIRTVFKMAQKGDIVLLLGKSHENSIIYKDFVMPYDEISEAENALSEMGFKA
ncbi:MAG: UDP-N-acetylmuramyl-tripeptide synthetase [Treponema sp.]|nr:UDP-N-acetylmuramyl-tripeptide synthetase [Spirochaetia bacterium]MDD6653404.1 UDP-N-acetylmuramyl-tripeptide synthetase [Treponema sp.]MDY4151975.1 UDP-N-acetylmuramyl-tripeptide synthetase [Treponema sp.]MDY5764515.1 UDP-N-acetylmuramyl-tripeptide synthetase [Treponema sp.]MDY5830321.1 UDP-N-acetylmuramyl-tripeptide synthetase [Treponema sp.]